MKYKVLVLDLDGTLTNSKKKITDYTKKILLNLQKKGVHIVLASGRPEYGIWPIAKELELEKYGGYILAFNGGKIVECSTKKTIFERTIEYSYVQEIYEQEKTGIDSRATILGHVQRGGNPTLKDRVNATRMGYYAVKLLEEGKTNRVVALQQGNLVDYDIQEALKMKKPLDMDLYNMMMEISF